MAVSLSGLTGLKEFDTVGEPATLAQRWKKWKEEFELYVAASGVTDPTQKRALLLHLAGTGVRDIFKTFPTSESGNAKEFDKAMKSLSTHFKPKKNVPLARQTFLAEKPKPGEIINNFITRLQTLTETCEYGEEKDNQVRDQTLLFVKDKNLKSKLYRADTLTLAKLLEIVSQYHDKESLILVPDNQVNNVNIAKVSGPLWDLTRKASHWKWGQQEEEALKKVKELLTKAPVMAYHKQGRATRLITDASPVGLGAILEQKQEDGLYRPVYYASRKLSNVEKRIAKLESSDWRKAVKDFLFQFRTTPHTVTGISPAELLMGRKVRDKLPRIRLTSERTTESECQQLLRERDAKAKLRQKEYADMNRSAKPCDIQEGEEVLLKQDRENKLFPNFEPEPYTVLERKGNAVVIENTEGKTKMRNIAFTKRFIRPEAEEEEVPIQKYRFKNDTKRKLRWNVPELVFFGFKISADGIKPDDKKVDAVKNARPPQNAAEVRSFLGLVNYCARFIPNFATLAEPLRRLTRGDTDWSWGEAQRNAFDRLRAVLTSDCVVAHFNQSADTQLKVDASPVGLGAILLQENNGTVRPVAYASRTLTDVERRYSQTEKEALAVVWACERFHLYLYGKEFMLYTDHKPLEVIYSPKSKPPPRIERWALRLQPYRFTIAHMAGKTNPADVLSRLPLDDQPFRERNIAEEYINYVTVNAVPKALTLEQIKEATSTDHVLQQVKNCLHGAVWPDTPDLLPYKQVKDELCASNGVVLRGSKIVIPTALHHATLCNAHEGHQGIVRTKQMIREKVWWPGILRQVEAMVKACLPCQSVAVTKSAVEPLRPSVMPAKPWQEVHIDLCGPFPTGETLLVCEDACSRWPEVVILRSTTSAAIIGHLKKIFAAYGLPEKVITDNGANLVSQEFEDFLKTHGVQHRKVTPYWPQANAEVERFNRTIGKAIRTVHVEGKDWRTEMFTFLLNYRATPHASTGVSPALLHLGREIRTKVPQVEGRVSNLLSDALQCAHMKDQQAKQRMKSYVDKKNNAVPSDIQTGDKVLLQQARHNKLTTRYDPKPYMVLERRGPSVILQRENGRMFMRNVSL
ncbi:hypothetical protein QZH41_009884, partial [Actinostola sp. cb2023]